jgi:hypothetical protein
LSEFTKTFKKYILVQFWNRAAPQSHHRRRREANQVCRTGLPDGLFSNQKSQFGEIFGGP